jgi:hypothetical protein
MLAPWVIVGMARGTYADGDAASADEREGTIGPWRLGVDGHDVYQRY